MYVTKIRHVHTNTINLKRILKYVYKRIVQLNSMLRFVRNAGFTYFDAQFPLAMSQFAFNASGCGFWHWSIVINTVSDTFLRRDSNGVAQPARATSWGARVRHFFRRRTTAEGDVYKKNGRASRDLWRHCRARWCDPNHRSGSETQLQGRWNLCWRYVFVMCSCDVIVCPVCISLFLFTQS